MVGELLAQKVVHDLRDYVKAQVPAAELNHRRHNSSKIFLSRTPGFPFVTDNCVGYF